MPQRKQERLEVPVTRAPKRLMERAARLRGTWLTDFVVGSTQQTTATAIHNYQTLALAEEACEVFANAVLNPPVPNEAALAAARRYKTRVGV